MTGAFGSPKMWPWYYRPLVRWFNRLFEPLGITARHLRIVPNSEEVDS